MSNDPREFNNITDVFERLNGDARMNPIPDHVMDVQSKESLDEAHALVDRALTTGLITAVALARRAGCKPRAISEFRNRKWDKFSPGTLATLASTLAKAINAILREREAAKTAVGGYVSIRMAQAIQGVVSYAIKRKKIAAFLVPAGCGKTMALLALRYEIPGAILITVTRLRGTVKSFLQVWARPLGLNETGRAEDIQDRITKHLAGSGRLVMIDEAHKLSLAAIDVLREIWDDVQIPIVLAATPCLQQTLTSQRVGTSAAELMDQVSSRIGMFRDLTELDNSTGDGPAQRVNVADMRKLYARGGVRLARDGVDFLCKIANSPGTGGLRTCTDLVQTAVDLYPAEEITAALLYGIARDTRIGLTEAGFYMESPASAPHRVGIG